MLTKNLGRDFTQRGHPTVPPLHTQGAKMLREIPDCELTDNPDYKRCLFEVQRAE